MITDTTKLMGTLGDHFVGEMNLWSLRADDTQVGIVVIRLNFPLSSQSLVSLDLSSSFPILRSVNFRQIHVKNGIF